MFLVTSFQKKRAIKNYIQRLGKDLAKRYGRGKSYTSGQVVKTVQDENYNWRHICYAHAMYTSFEHFQQWHEEQGEVCNYNSMREEITDNYFGGNSISFDAASQSESGIESDAASFAGDSD